MKVFKYLTFCIIASLSLSSCDEVEFSGSNEPADPVDTTGNDLKRRVLIFDFTGHLCAGCPAAAKEANEIAADFPGQAFALAAHPDIQSLTPPLDGDPGDPFTTNWLTPEGINYQSIYEVIAALPLGVVSGSDNNGNYWAQWAQWRSIAEPMMDEERMATVDFSVEYDELSRDLEVETEVEFHESLVGTYNLILVTVENNIVDWQKNGSSSAPADPAYEGGDISNYVHKHILRNHINGLEGDLISQDPNSGATETFSHSDVLDADYVAEEVSIYAYIYNTSSLEIIDVVEHHITD